MEDVGPTTSDEAILTKPALREQQICLFMLSQFVKGRKLESLEAVIKNALDAAMLEDAKEFPFGEASVAYSRVGCQKDGCDVQADCIFLALPEEDPCVYLPSKAYIASLGCLTLRRARESKPGLDLQ